MLFKNIFAFSLLALQAGFSGAKPISSHERREAAQLVPRQDLSTESGTITGTAADTVRTYGLATCVGMAASGTAHPNGDGTNKVLAHIQCFPGGQITAQDQINTWANTVINAGMSDIRVVIDILNPDLVAPFLRPAQIALNNAAKVAAGNIQSGYATSTRQSLADPSPSGEMKIQLDGSITVGGRTVMK